MNKIFALLIFTTFIFISSFSLATDNDKLQKAADKAIAYIQNPDKPINTQTYLLYSFLDRKFEMPDLGKSIDYEETFKAGSKYALFRRLFDANYDVYKKEIDALSNSIDKMTLYAVYCDKFSIENNYFVVLDTLSKKGGYYLTHALWACQLLLDNNCLSTGEINKLKAIKKDLASRCVKLIDSNGFYDDITIEAIAMLYYSNMQQLVKDQWIERVVELQRKDGGWLRTLNNSKTNESTTVLALWVLQEALNKDVKHVSMVFK